MNLFRIYYDLMIELFCFFTLELFATYQNPHYMSSRKIPMRLCYLIFICLYSIPISIPHAELLLYFSHFLYVFFICNFKLKISIIKFIKYELYMTFSSIIIYTLHTLLINDFGFIGKNETYDNYKSLICTVLIYIILCLYIYGKRLSSLQTRKHYGLSFSIATLLSVIILSYLSLLLVSNQLDIDKVLPVMFSFIFVIIAICLTAYNQIIISLEIEAQQKLLLTKYEFESNYYRDMETSAKNLSALRHDFKNYLIVLNGYVCQNEYGKLQSYLNKICDEITDTKLIYTPSSLVSAILNAKSSVCKQKQVNFEFNYHFSFISIDDFHLITILGNVLDNAIAAASKLPDGFIHLSMEQIDSFLEIVCQNNHCETIQEKDGRFFSTKDTPGIYHGIGIKNIQNSVSTLDGTLDIQYDDTIFTVSILLPNYK